MNEALSIPPEVLERAVACVLDVVMKDEMREVRCIGAKAAAKLLDLTPQGFRDLAKGEVDSFDFGPRAARWSLAEIKLLKEKRRVKAPTSTRR